MISRLVFFLIMLNLLYSCRKQVIEEVTFTPTEELIPDTLTREQKPSFVYKNHFDSTYDDRANWMVTPRPNYSTCWGIYTLWVPKIKYTSSSPGIHLRVYFDPPCSIRYIQLPIKRVFDPEVAKPNFSKMNVSLFGLVIDKTENGSTSVVVQRDSSELVLLFTRSPAHHNSPLIISWEPRNNENPVSVTVDGVEYKDVVITINKVLSSTLNILIKSELKIDAKEWEHQLSTITFSGIEMNLWE